MHNEINLSATDVTDMIDSYQESLIWVSLVYATDGESHPAELFEPSANLRDHAIDAVNEFLTDCAALDTASRAYISENPERAGHCLALFRNEHGEGFFDEDEGTDGLESVACKMGKTYLVIDENNEIAAEC